MYKHDFSVVISFAFRDIPRSYIEDVFESKLKCGKVSKVDLVKVTDQYNKVFVHFEYWCRESAIDRSMLEEGKEVVVMYQLPWFWIIKKSRKRI